MELTAKYFEQLTTTELYEILKARAAVFVVEQSCVYQDLDDYDKQSLHLYYEKEGKILAYFRAYIKNEEPRIVKIGRVLTMERGTGLGGRMLHEGLQIVCEKLNPTQIHIEAQSYATGFYAREGFQITSDEYLEDGIPHKEMILRF